MIATIEFMEKYFNKYNNEYFNGELKTPKFQLMKLMNTWGQFCTSRYFHSDGTPYLEYTIKLSIAYDRSQQALENTLVHEMCHQYIAQNNIKEKGSRVHHGPEWQKVANRVTLQSKGYFNITTCTASTSSDIINTEVKKMFGDNSFVYVGLFQYNNSYFVFCFTENKFDYYKKVIAIKENAIIGKVLRSSVADFPLCRKKLCGRYKDKSFVDNLLSKTEIVYTNTNI